MYAQAPAQRLFSAQCDHGRRVLIGTAARVTAQLDLDSERGFNPAKIEARRSSP
jgi:hypothetical protein